MHHIRSFGRHSMADRKATFTSLLSHEELIRRRLTVNHLSPLLLLLLLLLVVSASGVKAGCSSCDCVRC